MTLLVLWKGAIPISRPYDVYGAQDAARAADDPCHVYVLAHHLDDGGDGDDAHVLHVHVCGYGDLHHDGHTQVQMRLLVRELLFHLNSMEYLVSCSSSLSVLFSNSINDD